ncbi:MAG TPA: hypothetical protein VMF09_16845 [Solirubrobacteraceae bacterium]|nr:hypothetical protein [Solirubrobacteraceae bacterium]
MVAPVALVEALLRFSGVVGDPFSARVPNLNAGRLELSLAFEDLPTALRELAQHLDRHLT